MLGEPEPKRRVVSEGIFHQLSVLECPVCCALIWNPERYRIHKDWHSTQERNA